MRLLPTLFLLTAAHTTALATDWPHWRGPSMNGAAPGAADPPTTWSETENLRWKIPLPGLGHSTPVIVGDKIFLTAAAPTGDPLPPKLSGRPGAHDNLPVSQKHDFIVLALDKNTGKTLWQKTVHTTLPHEGGHTTGSLASGSPVADSGHVFAFFGSHGLYALTHDGGLVWKKDLGDMFSKHGHGEGSSPVLHGDTLAVNWDHEDQSFLVTYDKTTGGEKWRTGRDELTSWSSPITIRHGNRTQLVVSATKAVRSYDLETGQLIWQAGGLSNNVVASPVHIDGILIAGSSYEKRAMLAVQLDGASGDVTATDHLLWSRNQRTPYVPSPLAYRGSVYFLMHYQGILTKADPRTGDDQGGPFRLLGFRDIYASPVAAAGRVYVTDRTAGTLVLSHTGQPEILSVNKLDDTFSASPAISGKSLFLRGEKYLYHLAPAGE
ncbi:MAG: PQQ-binding-like beta-propeller repeat protein [Verrucomicrobiales bacterium]|nr:PQQ-binding-like beta-propeller repeat protein [Verrucomicrobiales bacterium]